MTADPKVIQDSVREACFQLVRLRRITFREALEGHTAQCHLNLLESVGTTEQGYWRNRLDICDRMLAEDTGVSAPPRIVT